MSDEIPLERQLAAVRDEIALRKRVYRRWVQFEKMTQEVADRRIAEMEAVRATLSRVLEAQREHIEPGLF